MSSTSLRSNPASRRSWPTSHGPCRRFGLTAGVSYPTSSPTSRPTCSAGSMVAARRGRFLVLQGLGQAWDLSTESYEDDATRLHDQLSAILRDGPECGVHTVAWCDSFANLDRRLRNPLREFAMRVGFAMGRDESVRLLESQAGTTLKENQACLYDDDRSTSEKFRAYGRFDLGWAVKQIGLRHG